MPEPSTAERARLNEIEDVMARLKVGRSTVFGLLASGELRSVKIGRRRLVPETHARHADADVAQAGQGGRGATDPAA